MQIEAFSEKSKYHSESCHCQIPRCPIVFDMNNHLVNVSIGGYKGASC
jgi:hypothetical protein